MNKYRCPRCGYINRIKTQMKNHYNRKIPCKVILDDISRESCIINMSQYRENNTPAPEETLAVNVSNIEDRFKLLLIEQEKKYADQLFNREMVISNLKNQIEKLLEKVGTTTYNTYNIVINPFGQENTQYINNDYIETIVDDGPVGSIPKLLQYLHFHPDHKENHNVKITNRKKPWASIYNGRDWEFRNKRETIQDMSAKAFRLLNEHYCGSNEYMCLFKEDYTSGKSSLIRKLNTDLELMIINSQRDMSST